MPVITRKDGSQFALRTYREILISKRGSLLKREIHLLQQSNGDYARIFKLNGNYEIVLSRETGYLLGETVWEYFKKVPDLIYCEAVPNSESVVVVIVRNNSIYLDAELPYTSLIDDLASLVTGDNFYEIYTYGDVPLNETAATGKFAFDETLVKSFNRLDNPLFENLPLRPGFRLLPVDDAINEVGIGQTPGYVYLIILAVVLLAGYGVYDMLKPPPPPPPPKKIDPYSMYERALATPNPKEQLYELRDAINLIYTIPGWVPTLLALSDDGVSGQIVTMGGDAETVLAWGKTNNIPIEIKSTGVMLTIPTRVEDRDTPTKIYDLQDVVSQVLDRGKRIFPNGAIKLGAAVKKSMYQEMSFDIEFGGVGPSILTIIADQLGDLPVVLVNYQLSVEDGLLSGKITLSILGS